MILTIHVAESADTSMARLMAHAEKVDRGEVVEPLCEVGFDNMAQSCRPE